MISRLHDRLVIISYIIKHKEEYQYIYDSITNNPQQWDEDKYKNN